MSNRSVDDLIKQLERLHVEETRVLQALARARASEGGTTNNASDADSFRVGDRVKITNHVRPPFGRPAIAHNQFGTVKKVTAKRVHILSDGGFTVQRHPNNVNHVSNA